MLRKWKLEPTWMPCRKSWNITSQIWLDFLGFQWLQNPWQCEEDEIADDDFPAKEEWIELRSKEALKNAFKEKALDEFWTERLQDTPTLAKRALGILVSFSTTYRCEQGFSVVMGIKTKKRNRLEAASDVRLALSETSQGFRHWRKNCKASLPIDCDETLFAH